MCSELTAWSVHDKVVSAVNSWMCRSELRVHTSPQVETFSYPRAKHPKLVRSLGMWPPMGFRQGCTHPIPLETGWALDVSLP